MKQKGRVIAVSGKYAKVRVERPSSCGDNCGMCKMCEGGKVSDINALNTCNADVGDIVNVKLASSKSLLLCGISFLLPLILFFASYWLTENTVAAVAVLLFSFVCFSFLSNRIAKSESFMSSITLCEEDDEDI